MRMAFSFSFIDNAPCLVAEKASESEELQFQFSCDEIIAARTNLVPLDLCFFNNFSMQTSFVLQLKDYNFNWFQINYIWVLPIWSQENYLPINFGVHNIYGSFFCLKSLLLQKQRNVAENLGFYRALTTTMGNNDLWSTFILGCAKYQLHVYFSICISFGVRIIMFRVGNTLYDP